MFFSMALACGTLTLIFFLLVGSHLWFTYETLVFFVSLQVSQVVRSPAAQKMFFCHLVIRFPPLPAPTVKCRMIFWHAMPWNAIAWWYAFAFVQQTLSSPPQGREMVQHILARFTYCNEKFCALFFRVFFFVKCWNAIVCVFCAPLRWKPYALHIPEDSNSRFFRRKREKKTKRAPKVHTRKSVHESQCNMRLPPWSAKETKYAQPNSTDMLSSAFGLFVCVRGGGMRCCRVCALNQHIPNRIS